MSKKVNLDIKYPEYFKLEHDEAIRKNILNFRLKKMDEEFIANYEKDNIYRDDVITINTLISILSKFLKDKYNDKAPLDIRKKYSKIIELLYKTINESKEIEFSDEQFDLIWEVLNGDIGTGTASVYILEKFETVKFKNDDK